MPPVKPSSILLIFPRPARAWQIVVRDRLQADGFRVIARSGMVEQQGGAALVLAIERMVRPEAELFKEVATEPRDEPGTPDLTLRLDGSIPQPGDLHLRFDGHAGWSALFSALLSHRAPVISIARADEHDAVMLGEALPALRDPDYLATGLDDVLGRVITLILAVVHGGAPRVATPKVARPRTRPALAFPLQTAVAKVANRIKPRREHWRIALRDESGRVVSTLADDGARYYADPFSIEIAGTTHLFFEDYPFETKRGVISSCIEEGGRFSQSRVVLERPYHLSYPFVFEEDGAVFMIPESGEAGRLELYRAEPFPDRWRLDTVLLDGVALADATLVKFERHYWLFAAIADETGTPWDRLNIYHAGDLRGPWLPHAQNPVAIDAGTSRPAGRMWIDEKGSLYRVAQDCRQGYGLGISELRVDILTPSRFEQSFVRWLLRPMNGARHFHTSNKTGGGLHYIDYSE